MKSIYLASLLMALMINASLAEQIKDPDITIVTNDSQVEGAEQLQSQINADLKKMDNTPPILKDAQRGAKLDPVITDSSWEYYKEAVSASERFHTPDKLISKSIPVLNEPGQDSQVIEVAVHYGVTISFKNTKGESLFIERYSEGNPDVVSIDDGNSDSGSNGSEVTHFLTITNQKRVGSTNLHVWLVNSRSSLSFYVKIVDNPEIYADRIDFIVVEPGEDSVGEKLTLNGFDELTMVLNNRKPVEGATRIRFSDESVTGWAKDGMMWIRTAERLLFPTHSPDMALSSDTVHGMRVYYVPRHPIIHVAGNDGDIRKLTLKGAANE